MITGFNTQWNGEPSRFVHVDYPQWRFSYRGVADKLRVERRRLACQQELEKIAVGGPYRVIPELARRSQRRRNRLAAL